MAHSDTLTLRNCFDGHKRTAWGCRGCGRISIAGKLVIIWEKNSIFGQIRQFHWHFSKL